MACPPPQSSPAAAASPCRKADSPTRSPVRSTQTPDREFPSPAGRRKSLHLQQFLATAYPSPPRSPLPPLRRPPPATSANSLPRLLATLRPAQTNTHPLAPPLPSNTAPPPIHLRHCFPSRKARTPFAAGRGSTARSGPKTLWPRCSPRPPSNLHPRLQSAPWSNGPLHAFPRLSVLSFQVSQNFTASIRRLRSPLAR